MCIFRVTVGDVFTAVLLVLVALFLLLLRWAARRPVVQVARGEALDRLAANLGYERWEGEDDAAFRKRIRECSGRPV